MLLKIIPSPPPLAAAGASAIAGVKEGAGVVAAAFSKGGGWGIADGTEVGARVGFRIGAVVTVGSGIDDASALAVSTAQNAPKKSNAS